jgi:hypothetical protein
MRQRAQQLPPARGSRRYATWPCRTSCSTWTVTYATSFSEEAALERLEAAIGHQRHPASPLSVENAKGRSLYDPNFFASMDNQFSPLSKVVLDSHLSKRQGVNAARQELVEKLQGTRLHSRRREYCAQSRGDRSALYRTGRVVGSPSAARLRLEDEFALASPFRIDACAAVDSMLGKATMNVVRFGDPNQGNPIVSPDELETIPQYSLTILQSDLIAEQSLEIDAVGPDGTPLCGAAPGSPPRPPCSVDVAIIRHAFYSDAGSFLLVRASCTQLCPGGTLVASFTRRQAGSASLALLQAVDAGVLSVVGQLSPLALRPGSCKDTYVLELRRTAVEVEAMDSMNS